MRAFLVLLSLVVSSAALAAETVEVWKDPNCGCCTGWVDHLRASGFEVRVNDVADLDEARARNGVPRALGACHTARVGGYAVEGHVPAADLRRLLKQRPRAAGLALPGMPAGSPGMEAASDKPYQTILFSADGTARVWQTHRPNAHLGGAPHR